jgi:TM2 domain-containing membrane protein YozV
MKDKNVAGLLALFFGGLGVHRFYLGQAGLGIFYLIFCWFPLIWVLGLIDAIVFFSMDKEHFDIKYNKQFYRTSRRRDRKTDFDRKTYRNRDRWESREKRRENRVERRENRVERRRPTRRKTPKTNPYKQSGVQKYKDYDYDGAIEDFKKALEISPEDVAVHFNLACAYSLNEDAEKAFYHLDRAVGNGFNDFKRIKEHDALAFLRIQPPFEEFEQNGFRSIPRLDAPKENLLDSNPDAGSEELLEQLRKLGELREKGLLTNEEFTAQKKKLLG